VVFVIVVYDVASDRTSLFLKLCRQYLTHVQYSVFEGEISQGAAEELSHKLSNMLSAGESVIMYEASGENVVTRTVHGEDPRDEERFL
jgi:CRISPR-associated protein Cas2